MKKTCSFLLALLLGLCLILSGCQQSAQVKITQYNDDGTVVLPEEGEEVAVMRIADYGDVVIRLFPEAAPKAVENFVTHAKEGYYNGLTFHRVIANFAIQSGDPTGNGTGGESIYGKPFENEINDSLLNYTGAVAMANAGPGTNESQYYINAGSYYQLSDDFFNVFEQLVASGQMTGRAQFSAAERALYEKVGGNPALDGNYTVFGQVIKGIEVVKAIDVVETYTDPVTGQADIPVTPVIVESITIEPYHAD